MAVSDIKSSKYFNWKLNDLQFVVWNSSEWLIVGYCQISYFDIMIVEAIFFFFIKFDPIWRCSSQIIWIRHKNASNYRHNFVMIISAFLTSDWTTLYKENETKLQYIVLFFICGLRGSLTCGYHADSSKNYWGLSDDKRSKIPSYFA